MTVVYDVVVSVQGKLTLAASLLQLLQAARY